MKTRSLRLTFGAVAGGLAIAFALFHLGTAQFGLLPGLQQRVVHLTFVLLLIFLGDAATAGPGRRRVVAAGCAVLALAVGAYTFAVEDQISDSSRVGTMTNVQLAAGVVLIALCLEGSRRTLGLAFPLVVIGCLAYVVAGSWLPEPLYSPPVSFARAIEFLYFSPEGIFGLALGVSSTYLALFVIFGAFMAHSGLNDLTFDLARAIFRRATGGSAKISVVVSGVIASITGSDMANAASTGAMTIPLMLRNGYPRVFAASVEAVASNGAQLMPPVMGSAAFLMAEIIRVPYGEIALAATLPGLLYYVLVYGIIHLRSVRLGLRAEEEVAGGPSAWRILLSRGHLALPIPLLVYLMAVAQLTPMRAAYYAVLSVVLVVFLRRSTWPGPSTLARALRDGGNAIPSIGVATASVGIVIGVFGVTGLGLRLSGMLVDIAGGNAILLLFLTAMASLILGTGLPTLPTYIILAVLVAPALTQLGLDPLATHLFIFYFGNVSSVTPPVALTVIITAGMAKADQWQTAWLTMRMSLATFLLPFAFVIDPSLLLRGSPGAIVVGFVLAAAGLLALAVVLEGFWRGPVPSPLRVVGGIGAVILVVFKFPFALVGLLLFAPVLVHQWRLARRSVPAGPSRTAVPGS